MLRSLLVLCTLFVAAIAAPAHSATLYAIDEQNNNLITIDRTTGAVSVVGPTGVAQHQSGDLTYDSNTGTMYWSAASSGYVSYTGNLYTINLATGAATLVGSHGIHALYGLAFDTTNNVLYAQDKPNHQNYYNLYSINVATAAPTLIGTNNVYTGGLAYRADTDTLLLMGAGAGKFYSLDRTTGAAILVSEGAGSSNDGGITWDPELNVWWTNDLNGKLYRYASDLNSRTLVSEGPYQDGIALAIRTPEPASLAILGIGLLGLCLARRRLA